MNIEISYAIIFASIIIISILTFTRKMSMGIGLTGIALGVAITYLLSPYMSIVMTPVAIALFYGGAWGIPAILGLAHLCSLIIMTCIGAYNLMSSGGKVIWA